MNETLAQIEAATDGVCLLAHKHNCECDRRPAYLVNHPSWINPLPACQSVGDRIARRSTSETEAIPLWLIADALNYGDQRPLPEWARMWIAINIR
jgi:hypothetical protein